MDQSSSKRFSSDTTLAVLPTLRAIPMLIREVNEEHASGFAVNVGGLVERASSLAFWVFAVLFFALLFAASQIGHKVLRLFLFWTPVLSVATLGLGVSGLFAFVFMRSRGH